MEIVCSLRGQTFLELKLLYPGDQLDFWKLLVAKALEGPGLGEDDEFSKVLEKSLEQWKKPKGWLGDIGDEILPSYIGIIINHYKDPY